MKTLLQKFLLVCTILFCILTITTATAQASFLESLRYALTHTHSVGARSAGGRNDKSTHEISRTALMHNASEMTLEQIKEALANGADINATDDSSFAVNPAPTPLMYAITYKRDFKIIEFLINQGAKVNGNHGSYGSPLTFAMEKKNSDKVIDLLINHGADVNAHIVGGTPLSYVMRYNQSVHVFESLLKHGAKIDKNNRFDLLSMAAMRNTHPKIIDLLVKQDPTIINNKAEFSYDQYETPLETAIIYNSNPEVIETLLKYKPNDNIGKMLTIAGMNDYNGTSLEPLLKHGANINYHDKEYGRTPLIYAIRNGRLTMVESLLKHGASVNSKDKQGMTPLMWALFMYYDDYSTMKADFFTEIKLILQYKQNLNIEDSQGITPLMIAIDNGRHAIKLIQLLLNHGAKINFKNKKGKNALSYAIGEKNSDNHDSNVVTFLLKHGAKFNNKNISHWSNVVDKKNSFQAIQGLFKQKVNINTRDENGYTLLNYIANGCAIDSITLLLKHGAKVNTISKYGHESPFMRYANKCSKTSILKLFLKHGAKINTIDSKRHTALLKAIENNNYSLVLFLLRHGANPNVKGIDSALYHTSYTKSPVKMVNFLLNHGVKFTADDKYDWYSLTYVQTYFANPEGDLNQLTFLLNHGVNLNAKDDRNKMTLFFYALKKIATKKNISRIVALFLKHGANPNIKDKSGYTPFTYVLTQIDNLKIIELFLKNGADINAKTNDGQTPLSISEKYSSHKISEFLEDHGAKK